VFRKVLHLLSSLCIAAFALLLSAPARAGQHPLGKSAQPAAPALSAFTFDENRIKGEKVAIVEYTYRAPLVAPRVYLGKVPALAARTVGPREREDYGFTGKEADVEVGLTYFGKRWLVPQTGRWLSPDPLALHVPGKADLNLYAYVNGRVFTATDPLGLMGDDEIGGKTDAQQAKSEGTSNSNAVTMPDVTVVGYPVPMENMTIAERQVLRWEAGKRGIANAGIQMANATIALFQGPLVPKEHRLEVPEFYVPKAEGIQGDILKDHYSFGLTTGHVGIGAGTMAAGPLAETVAQLRLPSVIGGGVGGVAKAAPQLTGDADLLAQYAKAIPTESNGYYNVVTHADAKSAYVLRGGDWTAVSHRGLARFIEGSPGYTGQPICLIACSSGASEAGLAQNLANKLGTRVLAPTEAAYVDSNGSFWTSGVWKGFSPAGIK
jgi:RHS repeat-associated protein